MSGVLGNIGGGYRFDSAIAVSGSVSSSKFVNPSGQSATVYTVPAGKFAQIYVSLSASISGAGATASASAGGISIGGTSSLNIEVLMLGAGQSVSIYALQGSSQTGSASASIQGVLFTNS